MPAEEMNPWLDPDFDTIDTSSSNGSLRELLEQNAEEHTDPEPVVVAPVATPAPAEAEPTVIRNEDGSTITVEKTSKGWKATLDDGAGSRPEVFYGKTKDELWGSVGTAKIHANKKIREQNRKLKLGVPSATPQAAPAAAPVATTRDLTAEERLEIQTLMQTDPVKAMQMTFEKQFGVSPQKLVAMAGRGETAARDLYMEQVAREFSQSTPDYYPHNDNYSAIIGFLSRQKLGTVLTANNGDAVLNALYNGGYYTVENLSEAFEDLKEDNLLVMAPRATPAAPVSTPVSTPAAPPAPAAQPAAPAPAPTNVERRPRAGFGLRASETSAHTPAAAQPLTETELGKMTDKEVADLYAAVRRARLRIS